MKKLILLLLFALLPGMLFAETVMLLTRMHPAETLKGANAERFVAVEDGVEDQFFNAGHIIFDAGLPSAKEVHQSASGRTDRWAEQTAKAGGASYLLIVDLEFPKNNTTAPIPSSVSYRFFDLKTGGTLATGTVDTQSAKGEIGKKKPYDLCFALGRQVADNALSKWGTGL